MRRVRVRRRLLRTAGLAGLAGVAATGVVIARGERRRRAVTADEVRARLHERLRSADGGEQTDSAHA